MIPIIYINLAEDIGRRDWFEAQCAQLGLKFRRFDAINGRDLPAKRLEEIACRRRLDVQFGPAEIGCFLSQRAVWSQIAAGAEEWVFVAEDDLHLAEDAAVFFTSTNWIPNGPGIIKAESTFKKCHLGPGLPAGESFRRVHPLLSLHGGAGGYFLNKETAQALVAFTQDCADPADLVLFDPKVGFFHSGLVGQINPAFAAQDLFFEAVQPGVIKSRLHTERRSKGRVGKGAKLMRELIRPFRQVLGFLQNKMRQVVWQSTFESVPFAISKVDTPRILGKRFR